LLKNLVDEIKKESPLSPFFQTHFTTKVKFPNEKFSVFTQSQTAQSKAFAPHNSPIQENSKSGTP